MGWKLNQEKKVNRLQIDYMNEEEKIDDYSEGFWSINWKSGGYDKRCGIAGEYHFVLVESFLTRASMSLSHVAFGKLKT